MEVARLSPQEPNLHRRGRDAVHYEPVSTPKFPANREINQGIFGIVEHTPEGAQVVGMGHKCNSRLETPGKSQSLLALNRRLLSLGGWGS
jgi:hypothetical protein